jgi:hypothetical protein
MIAYLSDKASKKADIWLTEIKLKSIDSNRDKKLRKLLNLLKKETVSQKEAKA